MTKSQIVEAVTNAVMATEEETGYNTTLTTQQVIDVCDAAAAALETVNPDRTYPSTPLP